MSEAGKGVNVPRSLKKYAEGWERMFEKPTPEDEPCVDYKVEYAFLDGALRP